MQPSAIFYRALTHNAQAGTVLLALATAARQDQMFAQFCELWQELSAERRQDRLAIMAALVQRDRARLT